LTIEHAHIPEKIKFVRDGDSYHVKCLDGYEVAQVLHREDRYIGREEDRVKTFKIQNRNGRYVYLAKNDEYTGLVCRKGKQRIWDLVHIYTRKLCLRVGIVHLFSVYIVSSITLKSHRPPYD